MTLFWGLITIREFNYRFTNSVAYYEILTLDVPYTDYNSDDENDNGAESIDEESIKKNKEALERAKKRKNKKEE